jgi:hypothetical protein
LTTSNETRGLVSLPNFPNLLLRYCATSSTWVLRRSRMSCWLAASWSPVASSSQFPASSWKNQSGVCWYQTRLCPYTRMSFFCAYCMSVSASALVVTKWWSASYQPSGFMVFSGVTWSKCLARSWPAPPLSCALDTAAPTGNGRVSLIGVMSWTGWAVGAVTVRSSKSRSDVLPAEPSE